MSLLRSCLHCRRAGRFCTRWSVAFLCCCTCRTFRSMLRCSLDSSTEFRGSRGRCFAGGGLPQARHEGHDGDGRDERRIVRKGLDDDRVEIFPNWADVDVIRPLPHHNAPRRALGLSEGDIFVQYSGNGGEKQGLEVLLAAARRLSGEPSVVFGLFGEGASRATLVARFRAEGLRNVRFHDLVPWSDVPELLLQGTSTESKKREAADLLMPSKVANIMAAGRTGVATVTAVRPSALSLERAGAGRR